MGAYVARRLASIVPLWLAITALAFVIGRLAPGNPAEGILAGELGRPPTPAELATFDRAMGLDRPLLVQYYHWVLGALHGDLGKSYQTGQSVGAILLSHLPATLFLAGAALAGAVAVSVPLGIWAAMRAGHRPDRWTRVLAVGSAALPNFWVGYLFIIAFAVLVPALPAQGQSGPSSLVLPAATLTVGIIGVPLRLVRSGVLEVLGQDHIRTARSLGIPERQVIVRHVLRNALGPIVTYLGLLFAMLLSGVVVVETVFAWPGVGYVVTNAVQNRDYPILQGFVLLTGTVFVLVNLGVDLAYRAADPRVRLGERAPRAVGV
jgi:ABC-type dipeptide/oligopeptide/nickel transport system permease component